MLNPQQVRNAGACLRTINELLTMEQAVAFCRNAESVQVTEFAKTWIGVNFINDHFISLKLYLTLYEVPSMAQLRHVIGNERIAVGCQQLMRDSQPSFDPDVAGSGFTLCLKLDALGDSAYGCHCRNGNSGLFRHFKESRWFDKQYLYVSTPEQLEDFANRFNMPFFRDCRTLEIGIGQMHGCHQIDDPLKIIPVGRFSNMTSCLYTDTERAVIAAIEDSLPLIATCGGFYCEPPIKSVYFTSSNPVVNGRVRTFGDSSTNESPRGGTSAIMCSSKRRTNSP